MTDQPAQRPPALPGSDPASPTGSELPNTSKPNLDLVRAQLTRAQRLREERALLEIEERRAVAIAMRELSR